jgi:hypothetical protein
MHFQRHAIDSHSTVTGPLWRTASVWRMGLPVNESSCSQGTWRNVNSCICRDLCLATHYDIAIDCLYLKWTLRFTVPF